MEKEYKKFPIYKFSAVINNGVNLLDRASSKKMFKEMLTEKQLNKELKLYKELLMSRKTWYVDGVETPSEKLNINIASCGIEFVEEEAWCITWFSHYTIDTGESDEYYFNSFLDFVRRMQKFNRENGHMEPFSDGSESYWQDAYCLMGAEDLWRWARIDENGNRAYDKKPCRCKDCKEQGVVRWIH